jgi:hypothetical protein
MKRNCNLSTFFFLSMCFVIILGTSCKTEDLNKLKPLPVLTTNTITEITQNTATAGGIITSDNGLEVTARGVCWSLKPNPTIKDSLTKNAAEIGEFRSIISNLIADTTYYVRAYATNANGTAYGLQATFNTLTSVLPVLTTAAITDITISSAISGGNITFNGGTKVTARGVCWSTNQSPTTSDNKTLDSEGIGAFTSSIIGLTPDTKYYIRSYATNSIGTAYGDQLNINTLNIQIDFSDCKVWANYYSDDIYIINRNRLFKSIDNCNTWKYVSNLSFNNSLQLEIFENNMYATDLSKMYTSADQGKTWKSLPDLGEGDRFNAFSVDFKTNDIYASTGYALFRFDGTNWSRIKTTTGDNSSEGIAVDHNGNLYYDVYLFTIYKSIDKGVTWSKINYNYESNSWSTTGAMYVTDENILLMNRWWNGVYKLTGNDCVSLNNGLLTGQEMKGTRQIVTKDENYYTILNDVGGILGIYFSSNRGLEWNNCNYNLTPYDLRYFVNMAMNKTGTVVISIKGKGCYKLNKVLNQWDLIK